MFTKFDVSTTSAIIIRNYDHQMSVWGSESRRQATKMERKQCKGKETSLVAIHRRSQENISRILDKHRVSTAVRPHCTLRHLLVHLKDKVKILRKANCVYRIPCKNCDKSYVGETGRCLGLRMEEHRKEAERSQSRPFTRSSKSMAESNNHKSAITNHVSINNLVMDWDNISVLDREEDRTKR